MTGKSVDVAAHSHSSSSRRDTVSESKKSSISQRTRSDSSGSEEKPKGGNSGNKAQTIGHIEVPVDENIPEPSSYKHGKNLPLMPAKENTTLKEKLKGSETIKEQKEIGKNSSTLESKAKVADEDELSRRTFSVSSSSSSSSRSSLSTISRDYSGSEKENDKKKDNKVVDSTEIIDASAGDQNKLEASSVEIKPAEDKVNNSEDENRRQKVCDVPIIGGEAEGVEEVPSDVLWEKKDVEDGHKVGKATEEQKGTEEQKETEEENGIDEQKETEEEKGIQAENVVEEPQEEKTSEIRTEEEKKEEQKLQNDRESPLPVVQDVVSAEPVHRHDSDISSSSSSSHSSSSSSYGSASISEQGTKELNSGSAGLVTSYPIAEVHKDGIAGLHNGQNTAAFDNDPTAGFENWPKPSAYDNYQIETVSFNDLPAEVSDKDQEVIDNDPKATVFDIDALDNNALGEDVAGNATASDNEQTAAIDSYSESSNFGNEAEKMKSLKEQSSTEASKSPDSQMLTNTAANVGSAEEMMGETNEDSQEIEAVIAALQEKLESKVKINDSIPLIQAEEAEINKSNSGIQDDDMGKIVESLKESTLNPVIVNFSHNPLTSASVNNIIDLLRAKSSVEAIILKGTKLGDEGVTELVDGILELHDEKVRDGKENENQNGPQELDLTDCKLGNLGAESIAKLIKSEINIDTLNLSSNKDVTSDGWNLIGDSLADNKYLETLTLDHNIIGNEGMAHIADGLQKNQSITTLDLNFVDISEKGGECLMEMMKRNTFIIEMNLEGNDISQGLREDIQKYIKLNKTMVDVKRKKGTILGTP